MRKIKVLFVMTNLGGGGAERVFLNVLTHLDRSRFTVALAVGQQEGSLVSQVPPDCPVFELGSTQSFRALLPLLKRVWAYQPSVVCATLGLSITAALARPFFPKASTLILRLPITLSAYLATVRQQGGQWRYRYQYQLNALALRRADAIVAQSAAMKQDLIDSFGLNKQQAAKIIPINNPLDWARIQSAASNTDDNRLTAYRQPGPHLVSMGRLEWQKGYDWLIQSFNTVRKTHPEATLTLLGEGPERPRLTALIQQFDLQQQVYLPGFCRNPYPTLAHADLFVSSSRYEGFSNAILEALALQRRIVATACPSGIQQLITHGHNGWLVPLDADIVENLAQALLRALQPDAVLDLQSASQQVIERYGVETVTRCYEALFQPD